MSNVKPISSYEDLVREKERLTELLKAQRYQIQKDLDDIKEEFRPVVVASEMFGKLMQREDGKDPVVSAGTNLTIDLLVQSLFSKSNFFVKLILPTILKNLTSHYIPKAPLLRKSNSAQPVVKQSNANGPDTRPAPAVTRERPLMVEE